MGVSNRNEREYTSGGSSRTRQDDTGSVSSGAGEVGRDFANRYGGLFSEKDWKCPICSNINWARRIECNQCKTPKPGSETTMGSREGRGGGFMERDEVVEYRRSRDAEKDDEYDEFGRRRKKTRDVGSNNGGSKDNRISHRDKTSESNKQVHSRDAEDEEEGDDDDRWDAWNDIIGNDESSNENGKDNKNKQQSRESRSDNQSRRRSSRSRSPHHHDRSRRSRSHSQDRGRYRSRSRSRDRDRDRERDRDRDRDRRKSYRSRSRSLSRDRKRSSYRSRSRSTSRNRRKRSTYKSRSISKSRSRERRR